MITISNPLDTSKTIGFSCAFEKTRNGFRHLCESIDGVKAKCTYLNRTWEAYCFQSVLHSCAYNWILANTALNPKTKRDSEAFHSLWRKMNAEIDSHHC